MSISSDNPLRETLLSRQIAKPCSLVIFGATGDLTHRKLVPSLCSLFCKGRLNRPLRILGVARRPMTDQEFRDSLISQIQEVGEFSFEPRDW